MWTRRHPDPPPPFDPEDATEYARRAAVWQALADLYLDTPMDARDHAYVAGVLRDSGHTLPELDAILAQEVGPVLYTNLLAVAGVWGAWDPDFVRRQVGAQAAAVARRARARRPHAWWWPGVWLRTWHVDLVGEDWTAIRRRVESGGG